VRRSITEHSFITLAEPPVDLHALAEAKGLHCVEVTWVHHWTDTLFSFRTARPASFRFRSGEFIMLGLAGDAGKPLLRAYSIASPNWETHLEFFSIKVQAGPLTSRLQHLQPGDHILLGRKPTGTLVIDWLKPAKRLVMMGTGTGLAPFLSVVRDPATHDMFEEIVITHTVRQAEELAYRQLLEYDIRNDEIFGDTLAHRLKYYPTVTRGNFHRKGRITDLIRTGEAPRELGLEPHDLTPAATRVMLCGSIDFNREMGAMLETAGFAEGNSQTLGDYLVERAFVG
jgi:ferredoxin--NADP+ reductase